MLVVPTSNYERRVKRLLTKSERPDTRPGLFHNALIFLENTGAGEGIRTLDPNLGKVVLYP